MSTPYQRKVGDFEIRILPDGRLVFVAPDEHLAEVVGSLEPTNTIIEPDKETTHNAREES